jgi:hypothetical protein
MPMRFAVALEQFVDLAHASHSFRAGCHADRGGAGRFPPCAWAIIFADARAPRNAP